MSSTNIYSRLLQIARQQNITYSQNDSTRTSQVPNEAQTKQKDQFKQKVDQIKNKMDMIKQKNRMILSFREKLSSATKSQDQYEVQNKIKVLCDQNYELINVIKNDILVINQEVKRAKQQNPTDPQTNSKLYYKQFLANEIANILKQSQKVNKLIENYAINTSLKRIKYLAPQLDDQQARKIAQNKNGFDQILRSKTMGKASLKLKYRLDDILQKHQGILNLQKSVQQNARLMNQISMLVQQQGQKIDSVYDNIIQAKDYVQKAQQNLQKQKKHIKKSRKKMCCIILIGIIVLGLVLTPIIIKVTKKS